MEDLCRELLRKAACGFLVQGHIHNMSGPLQILSMQLELLRTFMGRLAPEDDKLASSLSQKLEQASAQVERLRSLLSSLSNVTEEVPTTLDLNELLRQEVVFWEGDLVFKHEVKKDLQFHPEPLTFYAPPGPLNQGLCALFWSFVPKLSEAKGGLRLSTSPGEKGPKAHFGLDGVQIPSEDPFLRLAQELLSPYASLNIEPACFILECSQGRS